MKKVTLLAAVAIILSACNNEDNYIDDPVAARISATISESPAARAGDVSWGEGDEIGITMSDRYLNIKYTTENGDGMFAGRTMYFKNKQAPENLTAYYPYSGSEDEAAAVIETSTGAERQTSAEQAKFDFLYAVKENVTGSEPNVILSFSHMMSKLTLIFENGNDGTDVRKITSVEINGFILEGTFTPASGVCAVKSGISASPLSLTPEVKNLTAIPSLILFPQTVEKVTVEITDSQNQRYVGELKFDGNRLESGNNYLYTITVKKTGLVVKPCSIVGWSESELGSDAVSE